MKGKISNPGIFFGTPKIFFYRECDICETVLWRGEKYREEKEIKNIAHIGPFSVISLEAGSKITSFEEWEEKKSEWEKESWKGGKMDGKFPIMPLPRKEMFEFCKNCGEDLLNIVRKEITWEEGEIIKEERREIEYSLLDPTEYIEDPEKEKSCWVSIADFSELSRIFNLYIFSMGIKPYVRISRLIVRSYEERKYYYY